PKLGKGLPGLIELVTKGETYMRTAPEHKPMILVMAALIQPRILPGAFTSAMGSSLIAVRHEKPVPEYAKPRAGVESIFWQATRLRRAFPAMRRARTTSNRNSRSL